MNIQAGPKTDVSAEEDQDLALLARAIDGDESAFGQFLDRHRATALGVAGRYGCEAEDIVQEANITAWRSRERFDGDRARPRNWYLMIVRNRAIDCFRQRSRRPQAASDSPTALERELDSGPGPEERILAGETSTTLYRAIASLPPEQREVIELAYFSELSHGEMAAHLGAPLGTVKGRTRGALNRLRRESELLAERELLAA